MSEMSCPLCRKTDDLEWFRFKVRWTQCKSYPMHMDRDGTISAIYRLEVTYPDSDLVSTILHDRPWCGGEFANDDWNVEY